MSELDQYIANNIRFLRKKMNWPLKRLADELGVSLQQTQRYESGASKISASLLFELVKIFNMDLSSFFEKYQPAEKEPEDTLRILLVEDNAHDAFFFRKALENYEKKVDLYVVNDGKEAFEFFQGRFCPFNPDIIFMDIHLPHVQGFELLQAIKRQVSWKNTPVIMMTNSNRGNDIDKSYALQSSGFIHKSFQFNEFSNKLLQTIRYWNDTVKLPNH